MTKFLIGFIIIISLLVGGYFMIQKNFSQRQTPQSAEKLTIATVDNPSYALIFIAKNKGYFKDEGLDVVYRKLNTGRDAIADVLKGDSDIAVTYETPVVRKIYEGEKLRIITTLHISTKNVALVARKDKGILTVNNLKGKKIGVPKNAAAEFFLHSYLLSQGVKLSGVIFVDVEFANMTTLLKDGKVDAVAIGNPYLYGIKKEFPQDSLLIFQSEVYTENSVLAGREDIIKNKKEALTRFFKALVKAENLYKTHNQEALNAVVAELPIIPEETIRGTWDQFTPVLKLDNVLLTVLNREGQWFKDNGIYTAEVPNFRNAIFTDYLKSVKPDAVTLY